MKLRLSLCLVFALSLASPVLRAQEAEDEGTWPEAFSKHFKGTIGDKLEVEMQLQAEPGEETHYGGEREFRGHYWYANKRIPIDLYGTEPDFGLFKLEEQVYVDDSTGWETTGHWSGKLEDDGSIKGTWTDKDGKRKLPFKLVPFQPKGSLKLKAHGLQSAWRERTAEGGASQEHSALLVLVAGDTPVARKINQTLLSHAEIRLANSDEGAVDAPEDENKDDDKDKNKEEEKEPLTVDSISEALHVERDQDLIDERQNWSLSYTSGVELNENGLLCLSHLLYQYTGGAHGLGMTTFTTFDTNTGKEVTIEQMFKPAFLEALPKIATEKYRALEKRKPVDKDDPGPNVESVNFEEGDAGWFLSAAGFVVHFDPYAIAAYARGNVQLTIPYAELEPWLTPDSPLRVFLPAKKK